MVGKYTIYLCQLQIQVERLAAGELFCPVSLRFVLYLSCNAPVPIKQLPGKLSKKSRNKNRSNRVDGALCEISAYCYRFLTLAQHESGTRKKTISWSATVFNKKLSGQRNLTAHYRTNTG